MPATLTTLRIRNLALVEQLDWTLPAGFTAITGETGAGKSVILGALNLLIGERADRGLLRTGAEQCSVEAVLQVSGHEALRTLNERLAEQGIEPCDGNDLLIKRVFTSAGANRQFVNCSATTLAVLKELGGTFVDLHGPHDHQSLFSLEHQRGVLDACAVAQTLFEAYQSKYRTLQDLKREFHNLSTSEGLMEQEVELLRHQVHEIESAGLQPGEEEPLAIRFAQAANSRKLVDITSRICAALSGDDDSILSRLNEVGRLFRDLERLDPSTSAHVESHMRAVVELEELNRDLSGYGESLDIDPAQFAELEARVTLLENLKRKYGPTIDEILATGDRAALRLRSVEGRGEELARLTAAIEVAQKEMLTAGKQLGKARTETAPRLAETVRGHLLDLGFKQAGFEIRILPNEQPQPWGLEEVEFVFSPNQGESPKPLRAIASSGEISRVMLALKTALAAQDGVSLLVFDEIDANVGGEIAHSVGRKMASLAEHHQVLVITHLPQVAAKAAHQFVVRKEIVADRTHSLLDKVENKARIGEIARMLGGASESAVALAETLLGVEAEAVETPRVRKSAASSRRK